MTRSASQSHPVPGPPVLVTGASGFVGRRLARALVDTGHDVRAMTRRVADYHGAGAPVFGDVGEPPSLGPALAGCSVAFYLVHSLDHRDFVRRDAEAAEQFGIAAARAGVRRIVYLGGLGDDGDDLSPHLRSRRECEGLLGLAGVPVTTLRAGIVIGYGGSSWDLIHTIVERIPALVVPGWARTRTQPIAVADAVRYLVGVLSIDDDLTHTFDIGGADVLRYVDLLARVSAVEGRPELIVPIPIPRGLPETVANLIASQVLPIITGVDRNTIHALLGSMGNEVVVRDPSIRSVVPFDPMGYDEAVLVALGERVGVEATG